MRNSLDFSNRITPHFKRRERRRLSYTLIYEIFTWAAGIIASCVLGAAVVYFFGLRTTVVGTSMEPLLSSGEKVLLNRVTYQFSAPERGDVIAFYPNNNRKSHIYIKRVIGLPGETIKIKDDHVYINDSRYFLDTVETTREAGIADEGVKLELDQYFVLGENRDNSEDSRNANIGVVTSEMIEGKVWFRLGTANSRMGPLK